MMADYLGLISHFCPNNIVMLYCSLEYEVALNVSIFCHTDNVFGGYTLFKKMWRTLVCLYICSTVKPLNNGHFNFGTILLLYRGCPL